jgi:hypothetical protein
MSSTYVAYGWSSCEITWKNLVFSLLMPAKKPAPRLGRTTRLAARPRTAEAAQPLWIPPLVVYCLQPPCFVGVTNVGCRILWRGENLLKL